jgi:flagellin FlaB
MGRKICNKLKKRDIGSIGIGAMIVFISMVLVAGIAASVLVQTANRLELQAMQTGDETTDEVATGIAIYDIEGHKYPSNDLDYLAILVGPRAGSTEIDLSQTYIEISDTSMKNVLKYWGEEFQTKSNISGRVFNPDWFDTLNAVRFGVIVVEDADSSCSASTPVINRGDKVFLTVHCNTSKVFNQDIAERTDIWGMVQAEDGAPGVFSFRTPSSYSDTVYDLY